MTNQDDKTCTCPSGDGSLRWPCPVHPPATKEASACNRVEIAGWILATNADGTVGVVGPDGGDLAIEKRGRFEQRLLHGLVTALVTTLNKGPHAPERAIAMTAKIEAGTKEKGGQEFEFTRTATAKLETLMADGYVVNGKALFHPETGRRCLVDCFGYVGWMSNQQPATPKDSSVVAPQPASATPEVFIPLSALPRRQDENSQALLTRYGADYLDGWNSYHDAVLAASKEVSR